MEGEDAPPRPWWRRWKLWAVLAGVVVLVGLGGVGYSRRPSAPVSASDAADDLIASMPAESTVRYCWVGSAPSVRYTRTDASGSTMQATNKANNQCVSDTGVRQGLALYLAVQNEHSAGDVTCQIYVDGILIDETRSDGSYVIATCEGPS